MINKRPIHRMRFTQAGYEQLKKDYEELRVQRPAVVEDLKKAREMGDLKENGYYKASRQKLNFIDSRLTRMSYTIRTARVVEGAISETVGISSTVTLKNNEREVTYQFVGDLEADPTEGKLSLLSPIGRAVEGKKAGDKIIIKSPSGIITYAILKVS